MATPDFVTATQRLITQVSHWEAPRWNTPAGPGPGTRGDVVHALVQRLADQAAAAENRRPRPVPRLADTVLPDQLRVTADDLLAAAPTPETLAQATQDLQKTQTAL